MRVECDTRFQNYHQISLSMTLPHNSGWGFTSVNLSDIVFKDDSTFTHTMPHCCLCCLLTDWSFFSWSLTWIFKCRFDKEEMKPSWQLTTFSSSYYLWPENDKYVRPHACVFVLAALNQACHISEPSSLIMLPGCSFYIYSSVFPPVFPFRRVSRLRRGEWWWRRCIWELVHWSRTWWEHWCLCNGGTLTWSIFRFSGEWYRPNTSYWSETSENVSQTA